MSRRLEAEPELASQYRAAHEAYLSARSVYGELEEISGVSAGGMPDRVKCLHALAAHALAAGPGVNVLGDEVLQLLSPWWQSGPCVGTDATPTTATTADSGDDA